MPTLTLEGIIVKRSNFGEADRILAIVTPYKGKIVVLAKGVRRITSRRGGNVELLNKIKFQIFQGKGLPILTEAESLQTFPNIKNELILSSYGSYTAELMERLLPENQANPVAYHLLVNILNLLEDSPRQIFLRAFEVKLLYSLGFWSASQVDAGKDLKEILDGLEKRSWEEIDKMVVFPFQTLELERLLRYYIEKVLESPLKSMRIIEKLKERKI